MFSTVVESHTTLFENKQLYEYKLNGILWEPDRDGYRTRFTGAYICHSVQRSNNLATGQGQKIDYSLCSSDEVHV